MGKMDEMVLTFASTAVEPYGLTGKTGFHLGGHLDFLESKPYLDSIAFVRRGDAEENESIKQPIPYWIVIDPSKQSQPVGEDKILCYVRGKKSGEGRLVSKTAMGVGGHISIDDLGGKVKVDDKGRIDPDDARIAYSVGALRELNEELRIETVFKVAMVGMINDDNSPVGRVHFGFVHVVVPSDPLQVFPNEDDIITKFSWKTVGELETIRDSLEGWSAICLDNIVRIIAVAKKIMGEV